MIAHFVVNSVEGVLIMLCGEVVAPRQVGGSQVGIKGDVCTACKEKVDAAWVTFVGLQ